MIFLVCFYDKHSPQFQAANTHGSMSSLHSASGVKGDYDITGDLSLKLTHKNNELLVYVDRAKGLAAADSNGLSDPYVKTYLLPDKSKHSKRKTEVRKKTLNPVYKETLKVCNQWAQSYSMGDCFIYLSIKWGLLLDPFPK